MKTLIVYVTRTGTSKKIAEKLAQEIGADITEVVDLVNREGALRYVIAGYHASMKRSTPIGPFNTDLSKYDMVILVSPIWASRISSPMRTFIETYGDKIKEFALVVSHLDPNGLYEESLAEVEKMLNKKSVTFGSLSSKTEERLNADLSTFVTSLKQHEAFSK